MKKFLALSKVSTESIVGFLSFKGRIEPNSCAESKTLKPQILDFQSRLVISFTWSICCQIYSTTSSEESYFVNLILLSLIKIHFQNLRMINYLRDIVSLSCISFLLEWRPEWSGMSQNEITDFISRFSLFLFILLSCCWHVWFLFLVLMGHKTYTLFLWLVTDFLAAFLK